MRAWVLGVALVFTATGMSLAEEEPSLAERSKGQFVFDVISDPEVTQKIRDLGGDDLLNLMTDSTQVSSEMLENDNWVFGSGCKPRNCGVQEGAIAISKKTGEVYAGVWTGQSGVIVPAPTDTLPPPFKLMQKDYPPGYKGEWRDRYWTDPINDAQNVAFSLTASTGESRFNKKPELVARCVNGVLDVFVVWHDFLGLAGEERGAEMRFDSTPAEMRSWWISDAQHSSFYTPGKGGELLKEMLQADRLILRTTPYNSTPITATFNLTGVGNVLPILSRFCDFQG